MKSIITSEAILPKPTEDADTWSLGPVDWVHEPTIEDERAYGFEEEEEEGMTLSEIISGFVSRKYGVKVITHDNMEHQSDGIFSISGTFHAVLAFAADYNRVSDPKNEIASLQVEDVLAFHQKDSDQ